MWNRLLRRWDRWRHRERYEREMAEELRFHLEEEEEQLREEGLSEAHARREARRDFGSVAAASEGVREAWGWMRAETWWRDIRYGLRALANSPGFTATAVLSLALGIGANTTIFSIIHAVLLRSLPVEDPSLLVAVSPERSLTNPLWESIERNQDVFTGALAYSGARFDLAQGGETRPASGIWASGEYFRVLGVPAIEGRVFEAADDRPGCGDSGAVAVISEPFRRRELGGEKAVGRTIHLNRQPFEVIGVTPGWFRGLEADHRFDVAVPLGCITRFPGNEETLEARSRWWLRVVGRLRPGVTPEQASARIEALSPVFFGETTPENWSAENQEEYRQRKLGAASAATGFSRAGRSYETALWALMGIVAMVLVIACMNIANLLLARGATRRRELTMRLAMGAGRLRLVRQLLTESTLLSVLGAAGGLVIALWSAPMLVRFLSTDALPIDLDLSPDLRVLGFAAAVAALTTVLFGLAPAWGATRIGLNEALKEGAGAVRASGRMRLGRGLTALQIGVCFVLLLAAGLFVGTLRNLRAVDVGFESDGVLLAEVDAERVAPERRLAVLGEALERIRRAPGVEQAAAAALTPISGAGWNNTFTVEGYEPEDRRDRLANLNAVTPGYFEAFHSRLLLGRKFEDADRGETVTKAIVNEAVMREFFGGRNPVGERITMGSEDSPSGLTPLEIVGVVEDSKYYRVAEEAQRVIYLPYAFESGYTSFVVRYRSSARDAGAAVTDTIVGAAPEASMRVVDFDGRLRESLQRPRVTALLATVFGLLALLLAIVGLYGVTAYSVAGRKAEIGVRMALGARARSVVWLVAREAALTLAAGLALGGVAAYFAGRFVESLLFELEPNDPLTVTAAALALAAAAGVAALVPARRAAAVDPMRVLREE